MAEEVIAEIRWTDSAKLSFSSIIDYLQKNWSDKEVSKFINSTQQLLSKLKRHPEMCRPSLKRKNVRIAILNKHTQIIYHYKPRKKELELLLFWSPKQNPFKFKY